MMKLADTVDIKFADTVDMKLADTVDVKFVSCTGESGAILAVFLHNIRSHPGSHTISLEDRVSKQLLESTLAGN